MSRPGFHHLTFGFAYFIAAAVPIALTRLDGGVAFVWIATALLTAKLRTTARRGWALWLLAAGSGSIVATSLFGLGWKAAPAMMAFNLIDALIAERILSKIGARRGAVSAEYKGPAIVAACLAGALVTMIPAGAVTMLAAGTPLTSNAINWLVGHALGSLIFGPFMHLCVRGEMHPWLVRMITARELNSLAAVLLLVTICVVTFSQQSAALLFLPVLALTVLTYCTGLQGAAFGSVVLGLIGGGFTLTNHGETEFGSAAVTFQFFQFFLGVTVLTMLPVSVVISTRHEMAKRVQRSDAGYRLLADNIEDVVVSLDLQGRVIYVSPSIRNFSGQLPADVVGSAALDMIEPGFHTVVQNAFDEMIAERGKAVTIEFIGATTGDNRRWFEMQGRCVLDDADVATGVIGTIRETTARKLLETALRSAVETDHLTGLFNRRAFLDAARATARSGGSSCLALVDIDHLNAINTVIGMEAGDRVLASLAEVSRRNLRERDLLGRLEGDNFALLLPDTTPEQAEIVCSQFLAAFAGQRLKWAGRPVEVAASAGLALLTDNLEDALRTARVALKQAKADGGARLCSLREPAIEASSIAQSFAAVAATRSQRGLATG